MLNVKLISIGSLKEGYLREAAAEYGKRLSGFCNFEMIELKEYKLSDSPSETDVQKALLDESERIRKVVPAKSFKIALCVEGKQYSSEELAKKAEKISMTNGCICFIIGSSHGIDGNLKNDCDLKLSISALTFPHQLVRVIMLEVIYRTMNIIKGTKYHK